MLSHQKNIRDLGYLVGFSNMKVKEGRLFRGGYFGQMTDDDIARISTLSLTDVVDFRSNQEFVNRPDYRFEGVEYHSLPPMQAKVKEEHAKMDDGNLLWFVGFNKTGYEHMYNLYGELPVTETGINAYKEFFKILTKDDKRIVYFHCSQGKDRAGLAAYLLEIALGVKQEDAVADYLYSNVAMEMRVEVYLDMLKKKDYFDESYRQSLFDVFSAKVDYLNHSVEMINKCFGSVLNYIKNVLEVDIDKLRDIYLED